MSQLCALHSTQHTIHRYGYWLNISECFSVHSAKCVCIYVYCIFTTTRVNTWCTNTNPNTIHTLHSYKSWYLVIYYKHIQAERAADTFDTLFTFIALFIFTAVLADSAIPSYRSLQRECCQLNRAKYEKSYIEIQCNSEINPVRFV